MTHKVRKLSGNRWILEVEKDSKTKDLVVTLPPDALAQAGWDFGDELEWKINPLTHEVTLKKTQ
jgi:hypothetical protein